MSRYGSARYDAGTYDVPPGTPLVELYLNSVWTDITAYVRVDAGITITRGKADEQSSPASASCRLTVDNGDGRFSPTNTAGAYYGYLSLGTQLRVSVYDATGTTRVRFWGTVYEWPVSWSPGPNDTNRIATLVANGPRRRLQQNPALAGPYRRATPARASLIAYWPMEDAAGSTYFASAVSGVGNGTITSGTAYSIGGDTSWAAAPAGLPTMGNFADFTFYMPRYAPAATGINLSWLMSASVAAGPISIAIQFRTNEAHAFEVDYAPTADQFTVSMFNQSTGVTEYTSGAFSLGFGQGVQSAVAFSLVQNGTGIDWTLGQYTAANETGVASTGNIPASTLGVVTKADFFNGTAMSTTIGHFALQNRSVQGLPTGAIDGYAGESAYTRAVRLAGEEGVSVVASSPASSTLAGPQGLSTFVALFDEAATIDWGLSTEDVATYAVAWRGRRDMLGASSPVTLALTMLKDTATTYDDQLITNDVIVSRPAGSSTRATVTTGNRGTVTVGYYSDAPSINVYTDDLTSDLANAWVQLGTMDEPRLPALTFDAANSTVSVPQVVAMREGDTVVVTGFLAGSGVASSRRYLINGWTETVSDARWVFTVVTQPHPLAWGFVLDSSGLGILDVNRLGY